MNLSPKSKILDDYKGSRRTFWLFGKPGGFKYGDYVILENYRSPKKL